MATKNKTQETLADVDAFIQSFVDHPGKREDSYKLIEFMQSITGCPPKMWGPSIIGFGSYHYTYASGHEGDAPLLGFSPRKANLTLYVFTETPENAHLTEGLGKFKMSKACIYIKRLSDIDLQVLEGMCMWSIQYVLEHHTCTCKLPG